MVDGHTLRYTARAGHISIRDNDAGMIHGRMFFVSYTLDRPAGPPRPVTFLWNGGPGSNAALVHLIGFGPKRIAPPPGAATEARWAVVDNPGTSLDFTDLVFVDPIGTGYSRVTKPEYMSEFYQTRGEAESVAELIRVYLLRYTGGGAPIFLAGESYRWRGQDLHTYAFVLQRSCFCLNVHPLFVVVQRDTVAGVLDFETFESVDPRFGETVDSLFIQSAIDRRAEKIRVTYDAEKGFPTAIDYDDASQIADDEIFFRVSDAHPMAPQTARSSLRWGPAGSELTQHPANE